MKTNTVLDVKIYHDMWKSIHNLSELEVDVNLQDENIKQIFDKLSKASTCSCRRHAENIYDSMIMYKPLNAIKNTVFFMNHFHNEINFKLGKPIYK